MRRLWLVALMLVLGFTMGAAAPAAGQDDAESSLSWVVYLRPMRGMQADLEEALRQHSAWHAENNPQHGYAVAAVMTGSQAGQYMVIRGGMQWADLDGMGSDVARADAAHWNETVGLVSMQTASMVRRSLPGVSRRGDGPIGAVRTSLIKVKQGMRGQFMDALRKWHAGRQQGPERYVYNEVIAGTEGPSFTGSQLAGSWAEFESDGSFSLADAMGQDEASAMWRALTESIESRESNLMAIRQDLGYQAAE